MMLRLGEWPALTALLSRGRVQRLLVLCCALVAARTGATTWEEHSPPINGGATTLRFVEGTINVRGSDQTTVGYKRLKIEGSGPNWRVMDGVGAIVAPKGTPRVQLNYQNMLTTSTTIHQHGFTPSINMDGVPYISQVPIFPNRSHLYSFDIYPQNAGTYFVHSHYGFDHTNGLAAPLIVQEDMPNGYPDAAAINAAEDVLLWLEDFCSFPTGYPNLNPQCFHGRETFDQLKKAWDGEKDGFAYEDCMLAGTGGDVSYRYQLANGRTLADPVVHNATAGQRLRLRVINSATMSNYNLQFDPAFGETILIMTDGQPVQPIQSSAADGWWIAVAQRLDIVLTVPKAPGAYPIFARSDGSAEPFLRSGIVIAVGEVELGKYELSTKDGVGFMGTPEEACTRNKDECLPGQTQKNNGIAQEARLKAWFPLAQPHGSTVEYTIDLTGDNGFNSINGHRYQLVPMANNGTLPFKPNAQPLQVVQGQRVCINLINHNADGHAMHLHGHSFQVTEVNGVPVAGAIRDTVLVPKGGCRKLKFCFNTDNPGIWPIHCHMGFHLQAGMLTTVEYTSGGTPPSATLYKQELECPAILSSNTDHSTRDVVMTVIIAVLVIVLVAMVAMLARVRRKLQGAGDIESRGLARA